MGKRDIAILGTVRLGGGRPASGAVVPESRPWTQADEDEENRIMREDG